MATRRSHTVSQFLAQLPPERRREVKRVRDLILAHLPSGYEEAAGARMLVYQVPLARYSDTYNKQPLWYAALASEKSYLSLHLMMVYGSAEHTRRLKEGFRAAGKKLDMGKSCVHFHQADDLVLDVIGELIASTPMDRWVAIAQAARRR